MSGSLSRRHLIAAAGGAGAAALALARSATATGASPAPAPAAVPEAAPADLATFHRMHASGQIYYGTGLEPTRYSNLHLTEFLRCAIIARGDLSGTLPPAGTAARARAAATPTTTALGTMSLDAYARHPSSQVDGLVIVHRGQILYEAYPQMRQGDRHVMNSVTKPVIGLCVALLAEDELIDVTRPIDSYMPTLRSSGWAGVRIRDILDQASGIDCLEEGVPPGGAIDQLLTSLYSLVPDTKRGSPVEILSSLKRRGPPGVSYEYTSANSIALALLVETVAGAPLATVIEQRIWRHTGAEHDAWIAISPFGTPGGDGGLCMALRDLARFGMLYTPTGRSAGHRVVSDRHLDTVLHGGQAERFARSDRGKVEISNPDPPLYENWLWDRVWADGDIYKNGWGGQGLHVATSRDGVIAFFGTGRDGNNGVHELKRLARQLSKHLFPA